MADRSWQIGKVQVTLARSSKSLKLALMVLIVFSTAALAALWWAQTTVLQQTEQLRQEAAHVQYENSVLNSRIKSMDSIQGQLDIAQQELHMVSPDSIIFHTQSSN